MKNDLVENSNTRWKPLTFVIPAHNEEKYLPKTLDALQQSFRAINVDATIVVVNDASTDGTANVAAERGAHVVNVELRNIGAVRNAGAAHCKTPWLFFIDADTLLSPETLSRALDRLAAGDAGGGAFVMIKPEAPISVFKWLIFYSVRTVWQSLGGWAAGCFMFCQRSVFEDFGGFDEEYYATEEWFFSREVKKRGKFNLVRTPVLTSARKLEDYSFWELVRFVTLPILRPTTLFKSKLGLEILYDDDRTR